MENYKIEILMKDIIEPKALEAIGGIISYLDDRGIKNIVISKEISTNMDLITELEEKIVSQYLEADLWTDIIKDFATPEQHEELLRLYKLEGMVLG